MILDKWNSYWMQTFVTYFSTQWLEGKFSKWQIFHTPPSNLYWYKSWKKHIEIFCYIGFASTDNPCESFNAQLKDGFTARAKLSKVSQSYQMRLNTCAMNHRNDY